MVESFPTFKAKLRKKDLSTCFEELVDQHTICCERIHYIDYVIDYMNNGIDGVLAVTIYSYCDSYVNKFKQGYYYEIPGLIVLSRKFSGNALFVETNTDDFLFLLDPPL